MDINNVTQLLKSSKIRDRNDALNSLESISSSKFNLGQKTFRSLIQAIFDLIEAERSIYYNSKSNPVESRLSKASESLRVLTEKSLDIGKIKITSKSYGEIVHRIIKNFRGDDDILIPCSVDFSKIFVEIIRRDSFRDHLSRNEWLKIYNFVAKQLDFLLEYPDTLLNTINETLFIELYNALRFLILCDNSISVNYLHIFWDSGYKRLLNTIQKTYTTFKKENNLIITLYKIINKLIIITFTEDEEFVYGLVRVGIRLSNSYYQSQWDSLQVQLLTFLNLPEVQKSLSSGSSNYSQGTFIGDSVDKSRNEVLKNDGSILLYHISSLILNLLQRSMLVENLLNPSDIGLILLPSNVNNTWFMLESLFLKSVNVKPWLLGLGLSSLISSYFSLKHKVSQIELEENFSNPILETPHKKQRLDVITDALNNSNTIIEFCNNLLHHKFDNRIQILGLQLFVFSMDTSDQINTLSSEETNMDVESATFISDLSNLKRKSDIQFNSIIESIISTFENPILHFWAIIASRTILFKVSQQKVGISIKDIISLIKVALSILNDPILSNIACNLVYLIIKEFSESNLASLIDKSLISQIDNLIDLSEINGPFYISNESFQLWYSIYTIVSAVNIRKKDQFILRVQQWLLFKWDTDFQADSELLTSKSSLPAFIAWLCGVLITVDFRNVPTEVFRGPINQSYYFVERYSILSDFINQRQEDEKNFLQYEYKVEGIGENKHYELLLKKVTEHMKIYSDRDSTLLKFKWSLLTLRLLVFLRVSPSFSLMVSILEYQCTNNFSSFSELDFEGSLMKEIIAILSTTPTSMLDDDIFLNNFPFEKFFDTVKLKETRSKSESNEPLSDHINTDAADISILDDEFGAINHNNLITENFNLKKSILNPTELLYEDLEIVNSVKVIREYMSLKTNVTRSIDFIVDIICEASLSDFLYCLHYLNENFDLTDTSSSMSWKRIIRYLGHGPLIDVEYERSELTFSTISRFLSVLYPTISRLNDVELKKDFYDICNWLIECGKRKLISTDIACVEFCRFLLNLLAYELENIFDRNLMLILFFEKFDYCTNNSKALLIDPICNYLKRVNVEIQMELYRRVYRSLRNVDTSVEHAATYAFILSRLSSISPHVLLASIFNLLEYSTFEHFLPFLKLSLRRICSICDVKNSYDLLKKYRIELFKFWWKSYDIETFPFLVFGYESVDSLIFENCEELVSIGLSVDSRVNSITQILSHLSAMKSVDEDTILCDSMRLSIPLSFTKDGIRNKIFERLQLHLRNNYKAELKYRLSVIISSIILFMDITEDDIRLFENTLSDTLHNKSSKNIPSYNTISFPSGFSLLKVLSGKFYDKLDDFWLLQEVYFQITQILVLLDNKSFQKSNLLRKIKFILIMGEKTYLNSNLIILLVKIVSSLINDEELESDLHKILSICPLGSLNKLDEFYSLSTVIKMLSCLMKTGFNFAKENEIINNIEKYIKNINPKQKIYPILIFAVDILKGKDVKLRSSLFTSLLADKIGMESFKKDQHSLISLISDMFAYVEVYDDIEKDFNIVCVLCDINGDDMKGYSYNFKIWSARYLSSYYLNNSTNEISSLTKLPEYADFTKENFESRIKYLDGLLEIIIESLELNDFSISTCAESILGVLLWRYKESKEDLLKVFNFEILSKDYIEHIKSIDFPTCLLLNSNKGSNFFKGTLHDFIKDINLVAHQNFETWTSNLLLALFQELSMNISIIPVFTNFVLKVPLFANKVIPFIICFFVNFKGQRGVDIISRIINGLIELEEFDILRTKLLARIILGVRIGSKKNMSAFNTLERKLNLQNFILFTSNAGLCKTSLMLFEDCHTNSDNLLIKDNSDLLKKIYSSIDDEDLVYGLPIDTSLEHTIEGLGTLGNGNNNIQLSYGKFDTNLFFQHGNDNSGVLSSLIKDGVMGVSRILSREISSYENEYLYEWGWKLNSWEMPAQQKPNSTHQFIYKALKQVHDYPNRGESLNEALLLNVLYNKDNVYNVTRESLQLNKNVANWLQALAAIFSISQILEGDSRKMVYSIDEYIRSTCWIEDSDPQNSEVILLTRLATFRILAEIPRSCKDLESDYYWLGSINELTRLNEQSRNSNCLQKMITSAVLLNEIAKTKFTNSEFKPIVENISKFYTASTLWKQGQTKYPVAILKDLLPYSSQDFPIKELVVSSSLIKAKLASWTSESRQELPNNIMENYITQSAETIHEVENLKQKATIYQIFASFCEGQLRSRNFLDQISRLEKSISSKKREIDEMKSYYGSTSVSNEEKRSVQKYYSKLKSLYFTDIANLETSVKKKNEFASKAVEFYLNCISIESGTEEELDKFISLWLEFSENDNLNSKIKLQILSLPSFKFVTWCTQLISRLSNDFTLFQEILRKVVIQLCQDHPFHSFYFLISLRIHDMNTNDNGILKAKYNIANIIWSKLLSTSDSVLKKTMLSIEIFCNECIELAAYKVSKNKNLNLEKYARGSFWLAEVPQIPPPTYSLPIDHTKMYKDIPSILLVENNISIATSGLSLPKIVTFLLSNGIKHKVLLKYGTDDLRQDSIMEQVFEKVNNFFRKDIEARKRNLRVRTYKAIPLGPQAGIIEFVPSSVALIDAIKPYHSNKDNIKLDRARELMKSYQSKETSERVNIYNQIASKIQPILRFFFFDHFVTPDIWFNSRQMYTRGLATTSIVGHILGLGDRHCNNILLDKISGEPIHIDLGVSFDQGKRLPIPETVPFRLTRDLVDGLGVTGVEGGFKSSSEHTFRVLRANKDHILAILDVLKWDPLYSWSLSPIRKKKLQEEGASKSKNIKDENSSEAWNAINLVSDKLTAEGLSVEAIVRELIQDATNPNNLALIYFGWCPFF